MTTTDFVSRYRAAGWKTVPVHRPDPATNTCSCGQAKCPKPGKHPDGRYWPGGADDPAAFDGRNLGVVLGPDSAGLIDVDLDCPEAVAVADLLPPPTEAMFGRGGVVTHHLYVVADGAAAFAALKDPVLARAQASVVELRWPEWDQQKQRPKAVQTVFPPSLHYKGKELAWVREGAPAAVPGGDLVAAVRRVAAAVLVARYAKPKERHQLVLLLANLGVRAGWADDDLVVRLIAAVFTAKKDPEMVDRVLRGEGAGAVADARKRVEAGKPMKGLPALKDMLDPALGAAEAAAVVDKVREWLGLPDRDPPPPAAGGAKPAATAGVRYTPLPPWRPFPTDHLPAAVRAFVESVAAAMRCDPTFVALPTLAVYATWKPIGAGASGRMSCKGPNLQQLPRDARYRRCFAALPGRALVKADYSQIELRIAAKVARDQRMFEAYRDGEDLHTLTAKALLGKAEVTKADRQLAKAVNFGLLYGQGADGLRRYARAGYGVDLTAAEAVRHRETFFRTYPGLRAWHRSVGDGAADTRTLAGRRRLGVTRYTEKLNTPIQGSGADGLKAALALLWERRGACPDAFPVLVVHDEVVVECDADRVEEAAVWLRDAMRDGMAPLVHPVPVDVEVAAGPTWGG